MNRLLSALAISMILSASAFAASPVNINTADAPTIAKALDGVGPAKAEAIVEYRNEHGAFKSAAQLVQVKGIGDRTVEMNREAIRLGGSAQGSK